MPGNTQTDNGRRPARAECNVGTNWATYLYDEKGERYDFYQNRPPDEEIVYAVCDVNTDWTKTHFYGHNNRKLD